MTATSTGASALKAVLPLWHEQLQSWAQNGRLLAAAQEALMLQGTPKRLEQLIDQWATGNFRNIPEIVLLPNGDISGAMGAYAISTGKIYLNQGWLQGASAAQVVSVLTEELGHHLDGELNDVDTPGDEGEYFSRLICALVIDTKEKNAIRTQPDSEVVTSKGMRIDVETAAVPAFTPIRQLSAPGDDWGGKPSSDGTHIYIPSSSAGIATLGKYNLAGDRVWERSLGGGDGTSTAAAADGTILVAKASAGVSGRASTLARFNSNGDKIWEITDGFARFGGDIAVNGTTVYVCGGTGAGFNSGNNAFINAYSLETGSLLWSKTYTNSGAANISDLEIVGNRIYCAAALYGKSDFDTAIAGCVDLSGNEIWWKSAPAPDWNSITAITVVGNQVIGAGYKGDGSDRGDARIISFSSLDGSIHWDRSWGDGSFQYPGTISTVGGRTYVAYGDGVPWNSSSTSSGFSVVEEVDTSGNVINRYTFDVQGVYDAATWLVGSGDSLYALGQTSGTISGQTSGGGLDIYLASVVLALPTNQAPTDLLLTNSGINENSAAGTFIGTLSAIDPDANSAFTYALVPSNGTTDADNSLVVIVGDQLRVASGALIDYETNQVLNLNIQVTDNGTPALSWTKAVTVNVLDVDESPTDISSSAAIFDENIPATTTVATLSTDDPDTADTFTYSLVAGAGDTDNAAFSISGNQLKINASPDFESKSSYSIRLQTTDSGGLTFHKTLTFNVNNLNEAPTDLTLTSSSCDENIPAASVVASLTTTDPDTADTSTYSLVTGTGSTDNGAFTVNGNQLRINTSPDFESKPSYSIRLRTTDAGGLFFEKQVTINVQNLQEGPAQFNIKGDGTCSLTQTLTCSLLTPDPDRSAPAPAGSYSYKWETSTNGTTAWTAITGARASTYALKATDSNKSIRCVVAYTDGFGALTSVITNNIRTIAGTRSANNLIGSDGVDIQDGGAGNDDLRSGKDDDFVGGGDGNDSFTAADGDGNDFCDGGTGTDTLRYNLSTTGVNVDMINGKTTGLTTGTDSFKNAENVFGSTKADSITGNSGINTFTGNGGADTYSLLNKQAFGAATSDKITDFSSDDKILLSRSAFGIAPTATLSCATVSGTTALNTALSTANLFVYDTSTGNIYWNQNGTTAGAGTGGIFAVLTNRFATFSAANLGLVA